jgi:hypothetical protein
MEYAEIKDGVVVNVILADENFALEHGLIQLQNNAGIGWTYADGVFTAPIKEE